MQRLYLLIGHKVSIGIGNLLQSQEGMILLIPFLYLAEIRCIFGQLLFNHGFQTVGLLHAPIQDSNYIGKLSVGITQIFRTECTVCSSLCEANIHVDGKIGRGELLVGHPFVQFCTVSGGKFHLRTIRAIDDDIHIRQLFGRVVGEIGNEGKVGCRIEGIRGF